MKIFARRANLEQKSIPLKAFKFILLAKINFSYNIRLKVLSAKNMSKISFNLFLCKLIFPNYLKNKRIKDNLSGLNVAQRIMEKFGWRPGSGLGKNKQGMTAALIVQKVDFRTAIISVSFADNHRSGLGLNLIESTNKISVKSKMLSSRYKQKCMPKLPSLAKIMKKSEHKTCTIILKNMVCPCEVDCSLEFETKHESTKYGKIDKFVTLELIDRKSSINENVRVLIKFFSQHNAISALLGLNHRFFGGKIVHAKFHNNSRLTTFRQLDGFSHQKPVV